MNNKTGYRDFRIADFLLRIEGDKWIVPSGHFGHALRTFLVETEAEQSPLVHLFCEAEQMPDLATYTLVDRFPFPEVDAECSLYINETAQLVTMELKEGLCFWLHREIDSPITRCNLMACCEADEVGSLFRFGLWMIFGMAIAPHSAIAIHSSAIVKEGRAVLFLGESGTGKSTHTRLWREHIAGAQLLNDDSPILRLREGKALVYGTPWSGKTPCYRQEYYPIAGLVRLSQAPYNQIKRQSTLQAFGALLPSCPPSFCHEARLNDALCATLSQLIACAPTYRLACLPNREAALLSCQTLIGEELC
jgi:hypothetical protein